MMVLQMTIVATVNTKLVFEENRISILEPRFNGPKTTGIPLKYQ